MQIRLLASSLAAAAATEWTEFDAAALANERTQEARKKKE
jgi:hypothetical protein